MINRPSYPFAEDKTHLQPEYIPDPGGSRPFGGFRFLEGTVLLTAGANIFDDRRLRCLTRAMLGQSNQQIAEQLSFFGRKTSKVIVSRELTGAYEQLGIPHRRIMRPLIFQSCLVMNIMEIPECKYGNAGLCQISDDMLPIIRGVARGLGDAAIAEVNGTDKTHISSKLNRFGEEVGFFGRELYVLAALLTKQVTLDEVWPPVGYPTESTAIPSALTPLHVA